jgi:hypothetical protein
MDFQKVFDFIREMNREGVEYITLGAVALNLHGVIRATTDADFFIRPDRENIERLKRALRRVWRDPSIDEISADDFIGEYPSVMYGPADETFSLDFVTRLDTWAYDDLPFETIDYESIPIRVVTAAALYDMKMKIVRPYDRADAHRLLSKYPELGK